MCILYYVPRYPKQSMISYVCTDIPLIYRDAVVSTHRALQQWSRVQYFFPRYVYCAQVPNMLGNYIVQHRISSSAPAKYLPAVAALLYHITHYIHYIHHIHYIHYTHSTYIPQVQQLYIYSYRRLLQYRRLSYLGRYVTVHTYLQVQYYSRVVLANPAPFSLSCCMHTYVHRLLLAHSPGEKPGTSMSILVPSSEKRKNGKKKKKRKKKKRKGTQDMPPHPPAHV